MAAPARRCVWLAGILSRVFFAVTAASGSADEDGPTVPPEVQRKIMAKEGIDEKTLRQFLPFIYPMVEEPVGNGLILLVPECLGNRRLAEIGLLDVTAAPFLSGTRGFGSWHHEDHWLRLEKVCLMIKISHAVMPHFSSAGAGEGLHERAFGSVCRIWGYWRLAWQLHVSAGMGVADGLG